MNNSANVTPENSYGLIGANGKEQTVAEADRLFTRCLCKRGEGSRLFEKGRACGLFRARELSGTAV
jgi:hypothetical protein